MSDNKLRADTHNKLNIDSIRSVDNLNIFIDQTNDLIIVLKEHIIIFSNNSIEKLFGYGKSEIIGNSFFKFISNDAKTKTIERYERRMAGEVLPSLFETEVVCKDGSVKPVEVSTREFELEDEKAFILIVRDISDRKKIESALRESEAQYRTLSQEMIDAMVVNIDGKCVWANKSFSELMGYSFEEALGKTIENFAHPDELPGIYDRIERKKRGEKLTPFYETIFLRKDGKSISIEASSSLVTFDKKEAHQVIIRDITDRKRAEIALIESEGKYRLLFDYASDSIMLVSDDGEFLMMNKKAAEYMGGIPNDFSGKNMKDLFPSDISRQQMKSIKIVLKSGKSAVFKKMTILNGVERWFRTIIIPIPNKIGSRKVAQLIAHDITELRHKQLLDKTLLELHELLRDVDSINQCLTLCCQAIDKAELFKRAVFTLHNKEREIINIGHMGIDKKLAEQAQKASPPNMETTKMMMSDEFKISNSFFIPVEADLPFNSTKRYIPQQVGALNTPGAWKNGDELFVPVFEHNNEIVGWLSVDTPFSKFRPGIEIVRCLEQIVYIVYFKVKDLINLRKIEAEGKELQDKNITLKEVLANIEEEKIAIRREVANHIERTILPAIDKAVTKEGNFKKSYIDMAREQLSNLVAFSKGSAHIYSRLSQRESEVCQFIKTGYTNKEISELLAISIFTVQKHRESIRRKLGLKNKPENLSVFLQKLDYP